MESSNNLVLPGILVISPDMKLNTKLVEVKGIFQNSTNENNVKHSEKYKTALKEGSSDLKILNAHFNLDTKYYTCDVAFHLTTYDKVNNIMAEGQKWSDYGLKSIEGVIFVTDLSDTTREGVKDYISHHNNIMETLSPQISMCFANKLGAANLDVHEILEFGENDYLIEIIEEDLSSIKKSENTKSGMVVEKYGIERLIENLECHMWPNMSKKSQPKAEEKTKKDTKVEDKKDKSEKPEIGDKTPEKDQGDNKESTSAKKAADMLAQQLFKDLEDDDEKEMDELANIFHSIQNFRESSKALTDEQRRAQAANLIMKLVDNCKDMGDDDEDDDDNEDGNNKESK